MKGQTQQTINKNDEKSIKQGIANPFGTGSGLFKEEGDRQRNHRKNTRGQKGEQPSDKS